MPSSLVETSVRQSRETMCSSHHHSGHKNVLRTFLDGSSAKHAAQRHNRNSDNSSGSAESSPDDDYMKDIDDQDELRVSSSEDSYVLGGVDTGDHITSSQKTVSRPKGNFPQCVWS